MDGIGGLVERPVGEDPGLLEAERLFAPYRIIALVESVYQRRIDVVAGFDPQLVVVLGVADGLAGADLLETLAAEGQAYLPLDALPELAWDIYTGMYRRILALALDNANDRKPVPPRYADEAQLLAAMRYLLERTLDLPFGSLTIIRAETLQSVLDQAADIARAAKQNAGEGSEGSQISLF